MSYDDAMNLLKNTAQNLKVGYAYDLICSIMKNDPDLNILEPDALFRTLVMDEIYTLEEASRIYLACNTINP